MSSDDARTAIDQAVTGWPDDARNRLLADVDAIVAAEVAYDAVPAASDAELDRSLAAAEAIRTGHAEQVMIGDLNGLPPDDAGRLVADVAEVGRFDVLSWVVDAVAPHRFHVAALLRAASGQHEGKARETVVRAVALTTSMRILRGIDEVLVEGAVPVDVLGALVSEVARERARLAAGFPYSWWVHLHGAEAPGEAREEEPDETIFRGLDDEGTRKAYPRLDVASGTVKPDVVVVDQSFQTTVGLQPRRDSSLVASSPIAFAPGETVDLDVVLLFDPTSIEVTGSPRGRITVTDLEPHPSIAFNCVAKYGEELAPERRLGVQLLRDGQVVAVAWRTIVAVDSADRVAGATVPPRRDVTLLDLDPLLGEQPPDLVVSVCRADAGSTTFVWTAYAADPAVAVPDLPSATTLEADVAAFATETRRSIEFSGGASQDYLSLVGRAVRIGRAIPEGIREAIGDVVRAPGRTTAPAILLLTEELVVPWELAAFDPRLATAWGGDSPFLGAHVAISRWPLDEHKPRPRPRSAVAVRSAAVLTADYTGVSGWKKLESAVAEAGEVAALFDPPAETVKPELWTVVNLFSAKPERDVLHVALHGKYDGQGDQEGIVLLETSPAGGATAQYLTSTMLEGGSLPHGPFVFLNACQVASDERVLGDYAGFASTLLRIGATGVVAPLWNVRDDVAAAVAKAFYAATLTAPEPVSAAEAMRALRATYTEAGVRAGDDKLHATLVAYQVFGHPRLRLTHPT